MAVMEKRISVDERSGPAQPSTDRGFAETARLRGTVGGETGFSILEILVTGLVVGIAAVGVALMFANGGAWVVATGDERVATGLAQQKLEALRNLKYANLPVGNPTTKPCPDTPCYNETPGQWDPPGTLAGSRGFQRLTCVQYVLDTDFGTPAYVGEPSTNLPCDAYVDTATNLSCSGLGGTCVFERIDENGIHFPLPKRITVIVAPVAPDGTTTNLPQANPVRLQGWVATAGP
jgi:type II secretory pathway pseudopilin PulG